MEADLERFIAAISWEQPNDTEGIVCDFLNALIERFAKLVATTEGEDRRLLLSMIDDSDGPGLVERLSWPPLSRILLGRAPIGWLSGDILLPQERIVALAPPVMHRVGWLETEMNRRGWEPTHASVEPPFATAFDLLNACGSDVATFVSLCTRVIIPVRSSDSVVGSWSSDELIGATVLVNHDRISDHASIAEALVHEAVHHSQAMVEVRTPFITHPGLAARFERYPSPWTGAPLTAKSLVGACPVWFSIAHFWRRAAGHVGRGIAEARMHRAIRGFQDPDLARNLADFKWALDPDVLECIDMMRTKALRKWRDLEIASDDRRARSPQLGHGPLQSG